MSFSEKLARYDALTDAIREADTAIGEDVPADQSLRIIAALKRLRDNAPPIVMGTDRIDYLERAQTAARKAWVEQFHSYDEGREKTASATVATPIGDLRAVAWRVVWSTGRGERLAWAGEYWLDNEPVTLAEIKRAGLARRPKTRNRNRK